MFPSLPYNKKDPENLISQTFKVNSYVGTLFRVTDNIVFYKNILPTLFINQILSLCTGAKPRILSKVKIGILTRID